MGIRSFLRLLTLVILLISVIACNDSFVPDDGLDYSHITPHNVYTLYSQTQRLRKLSPTGQADFIYLTDTHLSDNRLSSPAILSFLTHNGFSDQVFWGGDAITSYGDIEDEWRMHQRLFLGAVQPFAHYYMVRGNHEFTTRIKSNGKGVTYDGSETAYLLRQHNEPNIVRPANDPDACYYYADDPERKLRFCVFDTTDSISSTHDAWGTLVHTSSRQLRWMDEHALHQLPEGYGIIVFTHIGLLPQTYHQHAMLQSLSELIEQTEAPILMVLSGHMHQDFQTFDAHGILHVLTGSDATYGEYSYSPFLHDYKRRSYSQSEQLLDCVSISADHRCIDMVRIGAGFDRSFHLDALQLSLADTTPCRLRADRLHLDKTKSMYWQCYNAEGYTCADDTPWSPPSDVISIDADGTVHPLRTGHAVAMAVSKAGHKEFFHLVVNP